MACVSSRLRCWLRAQPVGQQNVNQHLRDVSVPAWDGRPAIGERNAKSLFEPLTRTVVDRDVRLDASEATLAQQCVRSNRMASVAMPRP